MRIASAAAKVLYSKVAPRTDKAVAASALTQTGSKSKDTSKAIASKAGKILHEPKESTSAKSLAGSALTQRPGNVSTQKSRKRK